jgi:hypothetical protein
MSMDLDKDDLAVLRTRMTADEIDRIHRLFHEWSIGPESSFPTQLALLTKAQWCMAASIPRSLNDSRKWLELHLAEYRRQTKAMTDDFSSTLKAQSEEFKAATEKHGQTIQQAVMHIKLQIVDAEIVARRVKSQMENASSEWREIKTSTTAQCERLQQVSNDLQDRFAWRVILWGVFWISLTLGFGMFIGHYWIH